MKLGNIFGATFFSVVVALIIYDLVIKNAVGGLFNKYDNTFDPTGDSQKQLQKLAEQRNRISKLAA